MKNLIKGVTILGMASLMACHKDNSPIINPQPNPCDTTIVLTPLLTDTCFDLPYNPVSGFVIATTHWPLLTRPFFNPNDANEFLYIKNEEEDGPYINKLNFCSGNSAVIAHTYPGIGIITARWGGADWITYGSISSSLFIVKSNGDSLSQLSSLRPLTNFFWINNGDAITAYWRKSTYDYCNIVMKPNGEILDTLPNSLVFYQRISLIDTHTGQEWILGLEE